MGTHGGNKTQSKNPSFTVIVQYVEYKRIALLKFSCAAVFAFAQANKILNLGLR